MTQSTKEAAFGSSSTNTTPATGTTLVDPKTVVAISIPPTDDDEDLDPMVKAEADRFKVVAAKTTTIMGGGVAHLDYHKQRIW